MNTKQKVLLGLAGLTALAVAGGSVGTMAWFYSNTTVTASGLSMSVSGTSDNLKIKDVSSGVSGSWGDSVNFGISSFTASPCVLFNYVDSEYTLMSPSSNDEGFYGDLVFAVPTSNNPVLSNGSLSLNPVGICFADGIAPRGYAFDSYFSQVSSSGYYIQRDILLGYPDLTTSEVNGWQTRFLKLSISMGLPSEQVFYKSLKVLLKDSADNGVGFIGGWTWNSTTKAYEVTFTNGSFFEITSGYAKSGYPLSIYVWCDGNDSNCTAGAFNSAATSLSFKFETSTEGW